MKYIFERPKESGWYWRKDWDGETIVYINIEFFPKEDSWQEKKRDVIEGAEDFYKCGVFSKKNLDKYKAYPDDNWKVKWAGPILKPQEI